MQTEEKKIRKNEMEDRREWSQQQETSTDYTSFELATAVYKGLAQGQSYTQDQ